MRRFQTVFATVRLYGVPGLWDLLRWNVFSLVTCVRLRVDLGSWQVPDSELPSVLRIERGRLEDLQRFRAQMEPAALPADFLLDQIYGLSQFYLGFWEDEIAGIQ